MHLLLADIPVTATEVGSWLAGLMALLIMAWVMRQLWLSFFPAPPPPPKGDEAFVTQGQLQTAIDGLKDSLGQMFVTQKEFDGGMADLKQTVLTIRGDFATLAVRAELQQEHSQEYLEKRVHDIQGAMQTASNRQEANNIKLASEVERTIDRLGSELARMAAALERDKGRRDADKTA
jgi:hypothetical protein